MVKDGFKHWDREKIAFYMYIISLKRVPSRQTDN